MEKMTGRGRKKTVPFYWKSFAAQPLRNRGDVRGNINPVGTLIRSKAVTSRTLKE